MCAVQTVGTVSVPTVNLEPTIGTILPVMNLHGRKKHLKSIPVVDLRELAMCMGIILGILITYAILELLRNNLGIIRNKSE